METIEDINFTWISSGTTDAATVLCPHMYQDT